MCIRDSCHTVKSIKNAERIVNFGHPLSKMISVILPSEKFLRPVLNKYLEEPNVWGTRKRIWLEVKPTLDSLVDEDAMTEYTWMGDQDATSWDDQGQNQ